MGEKGGKWEEANRLRREKEKEDSRFRTMLESSAVQAFSDISIPTPFFLLLFFPLYS